MNFSPVHVGLRKSNFESNTESNNISRLGYRVRRPVRYLEASFDIFPTDEIFYLLVGKNSFIWLGPNPAMLIMDPELIREILSKNNIFQKPPPALTKLLAEGILSYEADKWAKHKRIINPAFHLDKLKV